MTAAGTPTPNTTTIPCDPSKALRLDGTHLNVLETSVMDAIVIFSSDNHHPASWLLNKKRRHVWCAIRDTERGHWVSYDWAQGIPSIKCEADISFDLTSYYTDQGYEVVQTRVGIVPPHGPLQWNNCVGHVKTMLAIDTYALVPNGLYKHLTRHLRRPTMLNFLRRFSFIPGFGGGSPPPPAPVAPVAKKTDVAVQKARADEIKRSKLAAGQAGTNKTANALATTEATTTKNTLLGN